jgi:hypothetical protein
MARRFEVRAPLRIAVDQIVRRQLPYTAQLDLGAELLGRLLEDAGEPIVGAGGAVIDNGQLYRALLQGGSTG